MKFSAFAVLSVLALSASAHGQEVPAEPVAGNSMTVGIDARTGKLRSLTDSEIQALSAQAEKTTVSNSALPAAWRAMPKTGAEAEKTLRHLGNGMTVAELPLSALHSLTVSLDANGQPVIAEGEDHHVPGTQEVTE